MSKKPTILVIDDDRKILLSLRVLFSTQQWETLVAPSVSVALKLFHEQEPDIVIIDYHMPVVSGLKGVAMLRAINPTIPILVLTADETQDIADQFLVAGASDFAIKPIRGPDTISRVALHLKLANQLRNRSDESDSASAYVTKGIVLSTMDCISQAMSQQEEYATLELIARDSGLSYQTVSRYMGYMVQENMVEVVSVSNKMGRPRQYYRLKSKK